MKYNSSIWLTRHLPGRFINCKIGLIKLTYCNKQFHTYFAGCNHILHCAHLRRGRHDRRPERLRPHHRRLILPLIHPWPCAQKTCRQKNPSAHEWTGNGDFPDCDGHLFLHPARHQNQRSSLPLWHGSRQMAAASDSDHLHRLFQRGHGEPDVGRGHRNFASPVS